MIVRPANFRDRPAIMKLAIAQTKRYPRRRADMDKIHNAITEVITEPKHFAYVVEDGTKFGTLLAITSDSLWTQRNTSNIALWVSEVPGGGAKLLREYKTWIKSARSIKLAGMCPDLELDGRILKLAERVGFERVGGTYLLQN